MTAKSNSLKLRTTLIQISRNPPFTSLSLLLTFTSVCLSERERNELSPDFTRTKLLLVGRDGESRPLPTVTRRQGKIESSQEIINEKQKQTKLSRKESGIEWEELEYIDLQNCSNSSKISGFFIFLNGTSS